MKMKRYVSAGMVIESAFELPGLYTDNVCVEPPQLRYVYDASTHRSDVPPLSPGINWSNDRGTVKLLAPDIAIFDISADGNVNVSPLSANLSDIAAYLVGSVLGIALHMRKIVTIHASAVQVGETAVLFCGESGAGKSTMAAALQQRAYKVLSDDLCALEISSTGVVIHSDGRKLKLWDEVIDRLQLHDQQRMPVQEGFEKYFVDSNFVFEARAPVRAIFELVEVNEGISPKVVKVSAAEAAALVRRNAYRPYLVEQLQDEKLYFEAAASLLRHASVYRLERAHRFEQLDLLIDVLQHHW
jgi:predicted ATPase